MFLFDIESSKADIESTEIIQVWSLRLLFGFNCLHTLIRRDHFRDDEIAQLLGLEKWFIDSDVKFDKNQVTAELKAMHKKLEGIDITGMGPDTLQHNIKNLTELFSLNRCEQEIVRLTALLHAEPVLSAVFNLIGNISTNKLAKALSSMLDINENEIREAISLNSVLIRSGLISINSHPTAMDSKIHLLSERFAEIVNCEKVEPTELFRDSILSSSEAQLTVHDYSYFNEELSLILPFLKGALEGKNKGINIFIHGQPGTGKTELVKAIAKHLNSELYEVTTENKQGDPVCAATRLRSYASAQSFLKSSNTILLFDEVEDVLSQKGRSFDRLGDDSAASRRKCWVNNLLETSNVPTIWVSNSGDGIDSAFIRRFSFFYELGLPSIQHKSKLLKKLTGELLSDSAIKSISEHPNLSPAQLSSAVATLQTTIKGGQNHSTETAMEIIINQQLKAQELQPLVMKKHTAEQFNPEYINIDTPVIELVYGLKESPAARLCFYGAPGTGKTAFGAYIAKEIGKPLITKKMSDLGSKYIGEAEKNIASAFAEAHKTGSVLQIDEVDSFLQDRRGAMRSWEISMVNEILTQMESFEGTFIASTNLMDNLDPAVLRRFDLKLEFKTLTKKQSQAMFQNTCDLLNIDTDANKVLDFPQDILTPGDFNVIKRQHRFLKLKTAEDVMNRLFNEIKHKEFYLTSKSIGFIK